MPSFHYLHCSVLPGVIIIILLGGFLLNHCLLNMFCSFPRLVLLLVCCQLPRRLLSCGSIFRTMWNVMPLMHNKYKHIRNLCLGRYGPQPRKKKHELFAKLLYAGLLDCTTSHKAPDDSDKSLRESNNQPYLGRHYLQLSNEPEILICLQSFFVSICQLLVLSLFCDVSPSESLSFRLCSMYMVDVMFIVHAFFVNLVHSSCPFLFVI